LAVRAALESTVHVHEPLCGGQSKTTRLVWCMLKASAFAYTIPRRAGISSLIYIDFLDSPSDSVYHGH